jgi:hypothetical protein
LLWMSAGIRAWAAPFNILDKKVKSGIKICRCLVGAMTFGLMSFNLKTFSSLYLEGLNQVSSCGTNIFIEDCKFIVFELTSFSFWNTLLTELSKLCTLSHLNKHKTQNKERTKNFSSWISLSKHRITYRDYIY